MMEKIVNHYWRMVWYEALYPSFPPQVALVVLWPGMMLLTLWVSWRKEWK